MSQQKKLKKQHRKLARKVRLKAKIGNTNKKYDKIQSYN